MSNIATYIAEVELALVSTAVVVEYQIIRSWANTDDGYLRIRATLTNGDFLEAAEYFALQQDKVITIDYRYQWMDGDRKILRRCWDSTPDHPTLENFPHHIHLESEENVVPGEPMNLVALLTILENETTRRP